jgi:DNA-binding response OmpR family regulator
MSRILVIDDNELIANMLREALTEHGYEVHVALDANTGYSRALEQIPDLIILDIQLPDVTGFDLCRIMKNNASLRDVPIIMATGTARSTEEKVKGFQMGVDDYLLKPFEIPELLERIRAILRRGEGQQPKRVSAAQPAFEASTPLREEPTVRSLSVQEAVLTALTSPSKLPHKIFVPGITFFFLMVCLTGCFAALTFSAGDKVSWPLLSIFIGVLWGLAVCVLVMGSTLLGVQLQWKEGAGIVSLSGSPLLLKLCGAALFALMTTLSPIHFSAGLPLLLSGASDWMGRLDLFEIWAALLLWTIMSRQPESSSKKAGLLAVMVWGSLSALAVAFIRMGGK